jgi:hypothetical protein
MMTSNANEGKEIIRLHKRIRELTETLDWYGTWAAAINKAMREQNPAGLEAVLTEINLDAGAKAKRARQW